VRHPEYQRAISSIVAHAPIAAARPVHSLSRLPYGFDRVDIYILDWIVAAGAGHGQSLYSGPLH
jgi:hypothetical protein